VQEDIKVMQEAAFWGKEKAQLYKEFKSIQEDVSSSFVTIFPDSSFLSFL
jgi:hypothetical protein